MLVIGKCFQPFELIERIEPLELLKPLKLHKPLNLPLLHSNRFSQIPWFIYINTFGNTYIIRKQLQWNNR